MDRKEVNFVQAYLNYTDCEQIPSVFKTLQANRSLTVHRIRKCDSNTIDHISEQKVLSPVKTGPKSIFTYKEKNEVKRP